MKTQSVSPQYHEEDHASSSPVFQACHCSVLRSLRAGDKKWPPRQTFVPSLGRGELRSPSCDLLHSNRLGYLRPAMVPIPLESAKVDRCHPERTLAKKAACPLRHLPCRPSQLGSRVAEDVDAGRGDADPARVSLQVAVERPALINPALFCDRDGHSGASGAALSVRRRLDNHVGGQGSHGELA